MVEVRPILNEVQYIETDMFKSAPMSLEADDNSSSKWSKRITARKKSLVAKLINIILH